MTYPGRRGAVPPGGDFRIARARGFERAAHLDRQPHALGTLLLRQHEQPAALQHAQVAGLTKLFRECLHGGAGGGQQLSGGGVFVAEREAAQRRVVRTGIENNGYIEIVDGLKPGERLIVKGYETLKNRSKIKVVK